MHNQFLPQATGIPTSHNTLAEVYVFLLKNA